MGVWFYPFLYSSLAGLSFSVFGFGEFAARLPSLIFSILLVHATICVARELTDNEKGHVDFRVFCGHVTSNYYRWIRRDD